MMSQHAASFDIPASMEPREQLKQAAARLFAEHGFHRLSLRQLGAAVGLHAGSLYAHFHNKDALLQELIEDGYDALLEEARAALYQAPRARLLDILICNHVRFRLAHPFWFSLASVERRHLAAPRQGEILRCEMAYEHLFSSVLSAYSSHPELVLATVRRLLQLLDALSPRDDTRGANLEGQEDWATALGRLAVQRLSSGPDTKRL